MKDGRPREEIREGRLGEGKEKNKGNEVQKARRRKESKRIRKMRDDRPRE